MKAKKVNLFSRGSDWRKWDLHFHTPSSEDYEDKSVTNSDIIDVLKKTNIKVVAITDHHVMDTYRIKDLKRLAKDDIVIFPGIEFCSDSRGNEPIHFIGIFPEDCDIDYVWSEISSKANIAKKKQEGKDDNKIYCSLEKTSELIKDLGGIVSIHAGSKSNSIERITNSLPAKMAEKEDIAKHVDIFELGQEKDQEGYKKSVFPVIGAYPMIICSDNHNARKYQLKSFCWLKADPTFEGLKQILCEPEPGERVWIGPTKPDKKNDYHIINKIVFDGTKDFPNEVIFNKNLCSIIGSRSSGKSALLNYVAHAIDKELVENIVPAGPGEGGNYRWNNIKFKYSILWDNGLSNDESPGKVVYIPQNFLFGKSKDSEEIKKKIEPVLFKYFPDFYIKYMQTQKTITNCNKQIVDSVEGWFKLSYLLDDLEEELKSLGKKEVIEIEKEAITKQIRDNEKKDKLDKDELKKYQDIRANLKDCDTQIRKAENELSLIVDVSEKQCYFDKLDWFLTPDIDSLPQAVQKSITVILQESRDNLFARVNSEVVSYKKIVENNIEQLRNHKKEIIEENKDLIKKYQMKIEIEELIKKFNEYKEIIEKINNLEDEKNKYVSQRKNQEDIIVNEIKKRMTSLTQLKDYLMDKDQSTLRDMMFNVEYGFKNEMVEKIEKKINLKQNTEYVFNYKLNIESTRKEPAKLLYSIYSGAQRVITGFDKKEVAKEILILTEKILFAAEMENDKIGGFSETTMTPGRRALFLLKLILAESEDKWPIIIDQPEDNLDARSITNEIVPFLKKKKKERQIIMVSHNANLVIGSDSEQIIVANRHGRDRPNEDNGQFNYLTGSIEHNQGKDDCCKDTLRKQGVQEHTCDILDGGKEALEHRAKKYNLIKR